MKRKLVFSEIGNYLAIYPIAVYETIEYPVIGMEWQERPKLNVGFRDWAAEKDFAELIAASHYSLNPDTYQPFYQIKIKEALDENWFVEFYRFCKDEGIDVYLEKLKKVNVNPEKPSIDYGISSGIDWFDMQITLKFNGTGVSMKELRRAVFNNDTLIKLEDGKFGVLSEEWVKLLNPVFLFGEKQGSGIRMRKNQFPIIESLKKEVNFEELADSKQKAKKLQKIRDIEIPSIITANLRSYQQAGFNWMVALAKSNLGGCLADDMGLGKTLQMLSLFAWRKQKSPKQQKTHLVVCPTSLLFNWRNEIEKFTPSLKSYTHWGNNRDKNSKAFKAYDIVLTTYGTIVSDIDFIQKFSFDLVVLDESQNIKTPTSQRTYCAKQLKSKKRFVLTGTPIENNTFELWSQMDFINPGLLGSFFQFKENFSGVLDQVKDKEKAEYLRKLINPFILRRTKSTVAKELPDKTEMVLYCEMEEEQRKVYDTYRHEVRKQLLENMDEQSLGVNKFTILPEILRLRQLCNSTSLLSSQEGYGSYSIKVDVLLEHIMEKHQNHKILVFSQFLGMLDLIASKLDENCIKHIKLTGATLNRQELVEKFEQDDETRVFLISLKAGGVGLNLVSAEYVYIVDPWWNPAVENQAIDRAYRIGQTKKVFAYRMVCSNTIEEKIQLIQQRKQTLADDIIQTEEGFVKNLTKEDLVNLFD